MPIRSLNLKVTFNIRAVILNKIKIFELKNFFQKDSFPYSQLYLIERKTVYFKLFTNKIKVINLKIFFLISQI